MRHLLVPIDPDHEDRTRSAIDEVVPLYRQEAVEVRLLRVQPRVTGHVAMFFGNRELQDLQHQAGTEALRFARSLLDAGNRFDLMISDVGLPGMNGRQLAEVARGYLADMPILFVTGYAENAAVRAGFLGTNMAMITKPFQIQTLSAKISEMLG